MRSKKIIGIIPARFSSTRFPGKMLVDVGGKPLILRTYENAKRCLIISQLIVATDNIDIFNCVKDAGGSAVMTPIEGLHSGSDRIAHVIRDNRDYDDADIIINIQGDEPSIDPRTIESVAKTLSEDPIAVASSAIVPISNEHDALDRSVVKCVKDIHGYALYFSRAMIPQGKAGDFKSNIVYYKHLGIYGYRREFLLKYAEMAPTPLQVAEDLEQLKILENGYKIRVAVVENDSIGIDTPEDLKKYLTLFNE